MTEATEVAQRNDKGQWVPGHSGLKSGRKGFPIELAYLEQLTTNVPLEKFGELITECLRIATEGETENVRLKAIALILNKLVPDRWLDSIREKPEELERMRVIENLPEEFLHKLHKEMDAWRAAKNGAAASGE